MIQIQATNHAFDLRHVPMLKDQVIHLYDLQFLTLTHLLYFCLSSFILIVRSHAFMVIGHSFPFSTCIFSFSFVEFHSFRFYFTVILWAISLFICENRRITNIVHLCPHQLSYGSWWGLLCSDSWKTWGLAPGERR